MSVQGQELTHAAQQTACLFDHLSTRESSKCGRGEAERFCRLQIDQAIELERVSLNLMHFDVAKPGLLKRMAIDVHQILNGAKPTNTASSC
jgi:hypothetical protein